MRIWSGCAAIILAALSLLSCSSGQQLQAIEVTPASEIFGAPDPSAQVQLRALGTYTHPPATKDLTNQVTWASNTTQVAIVSSTGLLSPSGTGCGDAVISATLKTNNPTDNVVVGTMTTTVDDVNDPSCPQPQ